MKTLLTLTFILVSFNLFGQYIDPIDFVLNGDTITYQIKKVKPFKSSSQHSEFLEEIRTDIKVKEYYNRTDLNILLLNIAIAYEFESWEDAYNITVEEINIWLKSQYLNDYLKSRHIN